jgi:hypothetical protein
MYPKIEYVIRSNWTGSESFSDNSLQRLTQRQNFQENRALQVWAPSHCADANDTKAMRRTAKLYRWMLLWVFLSGCPARNIHGDRVRFEPTSWKFRKYENSFTSETKCVYPLAVLSFTLLWLPRTAKPTSCATGALPVTVQHENEKTRQRTKCGETARSNNCAFVRTWLLDSLRVVQKKCVRISEEVVQKCQKTHCPLRSCLQASLRACGELCDTMMSKLNRRSTKLQL